MKTTRNSDLPLHHLSFPETVRLAKGTEVVLRPMTVSDRDRLPAFYRQLPEKERMLLQEDPFASVTGDRWVTNLESGRLTALLAFRGDELVGVAALHRRLFGWTRHVAYMQVFIAPSARRIGLATILIRRAVEVVAQMGLDKVIAEITDAMRAERAILEHVGFKQEAVLKRHALDHRNKHHDILVFSNHVADLWRIMEDLILDREFEVVP